MDEQVEESKKSIDWNKLKRIFTNKYLLLVVLIIICFGVSMHYRGYPAELKITDEWAENSMMNNIRAQITARIDQEYPNLPQANKDQVVQDEMNKFLESQKDNIDQQIIASSNFFRSKLQDDNGQTYLIAIDPYYYLRRAENLEKYGLQGESINPDTGEQWTSLQFAPVGKVVVPELHPEVIFLLYKVMKVFDPTVYMMVASFWAPAILASLCVIFVFLIVRRKAGLFGGFIAGLVMALHPAFLSRTVAGFSDTDAYSLLFALIITYLFLEGLDSGLLIKKVALITGSAALMGLFAYAWMGWWYLFDLLVALTFILIVFEVVKSIINKEKVINKGTVILAGVLLTFFIVSMLSVSLAGGMPTDFYKGPVIRTQQRIAAHSNFWPNIQTTVAELSPLSMKGAVNQVGSIFFVALAFFGLVISFRPKNFSTKDYVYLGGSAIFYGLMLSGNIINTMPVLLYLFLLSIPLIIGVILNLKQGFDIKLGVLFGMWLLGSLFAATMGTRFLLLLVPAYAVMLGLSMGILHKRLTEGVMSFAKIPKIIPSFALIVLFLFLLTTHFQAADNQARNEVPSMDDAWWNTLKNIENVSEPDAIINSWWDFGHWFKYVANRSVTIDGAGQEYQLAHWMGTILLTDSEEQAINTLRMLDCGSRESYFELLESTDGDVLRSVGILKTIIDQDETVARKTLVDEGINPDVILPLVKCDPPENYLITSEDMVGKAGVWGHFGAWNFERAKAYNDYKNGITTNYDNVLSSLTTEAEFNNWISPWPSYYIGTWINCERQNSTIGCLVNRGLNQGVVLESVFVNLDQPNTSVIKIVGYDSSGRKTGEGAEQPTNYVLYDEGITRISMNGNIPFDVIIDVNNTRMIMSHPLLSESLFTKLFFLDGRYTDKFELISDLSTLQGQRVKVWKVKWN